MSSKKTTFGEKFTFVLWSVFFNKRNSQLANFYDEFNVWVVQSNLCITTTLGTKKKWSLFRGGRYSEGQPVKFFN